MKKLDILIVRSFIAPFLATFLISVFVLVVQFFWLYIDDVVGKGVDTETLLKLIGVVAVTCFPLALPLALLLSSIMTFGNLGESFELVAIKAAGIPLSRFMRPLLVVTIIISGIAFVFSNNIIPVAQLKLATIQYDVIVSKPAFDIKEGVFYNKIDGYVIKVGKKDKNDSTIHDVLLFKKNYALQDNLLIAKNGVMRVTPDKKFLEFILHDVWDYEEKGQHMTLQTQFTRVGFKTFKKVFDMASFKMNKSNDSSFQYDPKMLSVRQLNGAIDSLRRKDLKPFDKEAIESIKNNLPFTSLDSLSSRIDKAHAVRTPKDACRLAFAIPDSARNIVLGQALSKVNNAKSNLMLSQSQYLDLAKSLRRHEIEWHRKFTLSVACIVLFLIGAPLGSIIRKGGFGTPLVFAVIFFVIFYLLNSFGEKFAKTFELTAWEGMWMPTVLLIPIGAFLTYKAMKDSQLFDSEFYYRSLYHVKHYLAKIRFLQFVLGWLISLKSLSKSRHSFRFFLVKNAQRSISFVKGKIGDMYRKKKDES